MGLACLSAILVSLLALWPGNAAEFSDITKRGYLIVAVKDNIRPLGFRSATGKLQGLEIDLARRLAQELLGDSQRVELQPVANQKRLAAVMDGEVDLAIAGLTATPVRSRIVSFSHPYYIDGTALVAKAPLTPYPDFAFDAFAKHLHRRIAVLNRSSTIAVVRYRLPQANLVGVNSYQEALELLETGGAAAFAADTSVLSGWVQEYPEYDLLPLELSSQPLAVAMPKGKQYQELRQQINRVISQAEIEGWLLERARYWGLPLSFEF